MSKSIQLEDPEWSCDISDIINHGKTLGFDNDKLIKLFNRETVHGINGTDLKIVYISSIEPSFTDSEATKIIDSFLESHEVGAIKIVPVLT